MNWKKDNQFSYKWESNVNNLDLTKLMKFVLLFIVYMISGIHTHSFCSINICLRWTARQDILTIICKIDDLHLPVYFNNNFGKEIARCSIPFPSPLCTPRDNNISVQQNAITNETIVKVRRKIDRSINGNWSCRHGHGISKYEANIEIHIPLSKGHNKTEKIDELRCLKVISLYIMAGVFISVVVISICMIITLKCTHREGQHYKRIVLFSKIIDDMFGAKKDKHSVKYKKIGFFISFVLLVFVAGVVIGVLEKDSCTGSIVFLILGISLCLTLLILFFRSQGDRGVTLICGGTADDSDASRAPGVDNKKVSGSRDEEAHSSGDRIKLVSGDERGSDNGISEGACYIRGLGSNNEGANGHGDRGTAYRGTERTLNVGSCNRRGSGSDYGKTHSVCDRKGHVSSSMEEPCSDDEIEYPENTPLKGS